MPVSSLTVPKAHRCLLVSLSSGHGPPPHCPGCTGAQLTSAIHAFQSGFCITRTHCPRSGCPCFCSQLVGWWCACLWCPVPSAAGEPGAGPGAVLGARERCGASSHRLLCLQAAWSQPVSLGPSPHKSAKLALPLGFRPTCVLDRTALQGSRLGASGLWSSPGRASWPPLSLRRAEDDWWPCAIEQFRQ